MKVALKISELPRLPSSLWSLVGSKICVWDRVWVGKVAFAPMVFVSPAPPGGVLMNRIVPTMAVCQSSVKRFAIGVLLDHRLDRLGQPPDCVLDIESALVVGPSEAEFHSWEVGGPGVLGAI